MVALTETIRPYRLWRYRARFGLLVLACTALNLAGLISTQEIGWSILFFDMIGTAVASMLGGAAAGVLVALITGLFGSWILGHQEYTLFSIVNICGALLWAIAPRTGANILGGGMFNPSFPIAYRRGMTNILVLGFIVGICCTLFSFIIQAYILHMKANADIGPIASFSGGTSTSLNNINMAISLDHMLGGGYISRDGILLISSAISNIPDKIIATVSAVFLIFAFGTLHNYKEQKEAMRNDRKLRNCNVIDNRWLLITLLFTPLMVLPWMTYRITHSLTSMGLMGGLCALIAVISIADNVYTRSIDRQVNQQVVSGGGLFFVIPVDFELKKQKDIFEDTLKMMVVVGSGLSFALAGLERSHNCAISESLNSFLNCSDLYRLAVVNILILTAYRYSFMVLIRFSGRV
jgi:hypothetical protein